MIMTPWSILVLCSFVAPAISHSNGMDMSMDTPMNLAAGNMLPYIHFTLGDTVWFLGWVPSSAGAMVGACIGLFLLSMVERWLAACADIAEHSWTNRANILMIKSDDVGSIRSPDGSPTASSSVLAPKKFMRLYPPFIPEFDFSRAIVFTAQKSLQILLMLAVMTFQVAFLISISIGSGVGEALFGRFMSSHEH